MWPSKKKPYANSTQFAINISHVPPPASKAKNRKKSYFFCNYAQASFPFPFISFSNNFRKKMYYLIIMWFFFFVYWAFAAVGRFLFILFVRGGGGELYKGGVFTLCIEIDAKKETNRRDGVKELKRVFFLLLLLLFGEEMWWWCCCCCCSEDEEEKEWGGVCVF